jgi:hypothetical protein
MWKRGTQAAEREHWNCDECRSGKVRMLQDDLQNSLRQIDELKARNRELETTLLMEETGKRDTMSTKQKFMKCKVTGDSILRNVGAEYSDMNLECLPVHKTEQLLRVLEKRDLGSLEFVIIKVGTNDIRTTRNLDFVKGEVYALVSTRKKNLPNGKLVLSGVLRPRDVSWRRVGALNDRYDWVANTLGLTSLTRTAG